MKQNQKRKNNSITGSREGWLFAGAFGENRTIPAPAVKLAKTDLNRGGWNGNLQPALVIVLVLFLAQPSFAADSAVSARASVDKADIFIGDVVTYKIEVTAPADVKIAFPQFAENLGGFAIKDFGGSKKKPFFKKEIIYEQWYMLDTFITGKYEIPAVLVKYKTSGGKDGSVSADKIAIEVKSILMLDGKTPTDIKDIKSPLYLAGNWLFWILGGIVVIIAAGAAFVYILLRRSMVEKNLLALSAHETAYKALEDLRDSGLIKGGLVKEYFYRLSFIVRQYLENRFSLRAPEMTTEEFLTAISNVGARHALPLQDQHIKDLLKDFLQKSDMIKFAKYGPTADEILGAFNAAKQLVDETKERIDAVS